MMKGYKGVPKKNEVKLMEMYQRTLDATVARDKAKDLARQSVIFIRSVMPELGKADRRCAEQIIDTYNRLYIFKEKE